MLRGERGIMGEIRGHQGTCIKDTWTKPKGGEDRGWEVRMGGVGQRAWGKM